VSHSEAFEGMDKYMISRRLLGRSKCSVTVNLRPTMTRVNVLTCRDESVPFRE
jgi:hypothetical protein